MTAGQIEHPVADVLRVLAVSRSSGAVEVRGSRSGTFFLHDGDITYAEAPGIPPVQEFDPTDPRLRSSIESLILEVGLTLLAAENVKGDRPLFRPGRRHWSGRAIRVRVEPLLGEIACLIDDFVKLGVELDDEVQLCRLPPGRTAVLSRQQWALAAEFSGPQTARSLARRSGSSLRGTIESLAALVGAGVMERGRLPVREPLVCELPIRDAPGPGVPVEEPPAGRPVPPESTLPQRVRGATPLPATGSSPTAEPRRPRPTVRREAEEEDGRALALRLLEGLRRL